MHYSFSYGTNTLIITKKCYRKVGNDGFNILSEWIQIIKNKISGFNYININKIKYKNRKFYL